MEINVTNFLYRNELLQTFSDYRLKTKQNVLWTVYLDYKLVTNMFEEFIQIYNVFSFLNQY